MLKAKFPTPVTQGTEHPEALQCQGLLGKRGLKKWSKPLHVAALDPTSTLQQWQPGWPFVSLLQGYCHEQSCSSMHSFQLVFMFHHRSAQCLPTWKGQGQSRVPSMWWVKTKTHKGYRRAQTWAVDYRDLAPCWLPEPRGALDPTIILE